MLSDEKLKELAVSIGFKSHPAWGEICVKHSNGSFVIIDHDLMNFGRAVAEAAVKAEREACAKLCENMYRRDLVQFAPEYTAADEIAQEIRARGDCTTPPAAPVPEQASAVKDAGGGDEPFGYFRAEPFGWVDCKSTDDEARPLYERPQASATVPDGFVLVPIVSTTAMDLAGVAASEDGISRGMAEEIWAAMLAASQPEVTP